MKTFNATQAKNQFGQLLDDAQAGPVAIQKNGRDIAVIVSQAEFARLTGASPVRPMIKELHRRSIERRREVYKALAK